jgi:hypothetical protein
MTDPDTTDLTGDQADALDRAAAIVLRAREEAAALLVDAGLRAPDDAGWFANPCTAVLPPPPAHHACGCSHFDGVVSGPCRTVVTDVTGPDEGDGPPRRVCGHRAWQHLSP